MCGQENETDNHFVTALTVSKIIQQKSHSPANPSLSLDLYKYILIKLPNLQY